MPIVEIKTNLPKGKIDDNFVVDFSQLLSKVLSKPIEVCWCYRVVYRMFTY